MRVLAMARTVDDFPRQPPSPVDTRRLDRRGKRESEEAREINYAEIAN